MAKIVDICIKSSAVRLHSVWFPANVHFQSSFCIVPGKTGQFGPCNTCGRFRWYSRLLWPLSVSLCDVGNGPGSLVDMVFSLPAHELRHSFQICVWKVTSDMTGGSRGTDIPSGQLRCHFWAGVERLGRGWGDRAFGRFLPALPLLNLYELGIYVE